MTCRTLLVGLVVMTACYDDVPVVEATVPAFVELKAPLPRDVHGDLATFRWDVFASPEGSIVARATSAEPRPAFQFDRRGVYLLDRWIVAGLSERLTYHLVVNVTGAAPIANVAGTRYLGVGETAVLDARASASPEHRSLTYRWQLATQPPLSQLVLPAAKIEGEMLSFVPDVAGEYVAELFVFDGELWSEPGTILVEAHD